MTTQDLGPLFRKATEHLFTFHSIERMEQRGIATNDIIDIMNKGRAIQRSERIGIGLCPGEIPKRKAFKKKFERLQDAFVVVEPEDFLIITVRPGWTIINRHTDRKAILRYQLNHWSYNRKRSNKKQWLSTDFKHPSDLLFTFQATQEMELLGITTNDIWQIVGRGWRFLKSRFLYLFEPSRFYFDDLQEPCMKGMNMVIDRKYSTVIDFYKAVPLQFLFSDKLNIH